MRRIAVLVKQVPKSPDQPLTASGSLNRSVPAEMNPHCRRAVAKSVELAGADGELVIITMGPPSASAVLVEALTFAERTTTRVRGILVTDPRLAGADTLVTATALSRSVQQLGPFDLIMAGRGTSDSDTGQVVAQVAELLGLPMLSAVRDCRVDETEVTARVEHDDAWYNATVSLPAVLACAERLCAPCKLAPEELDSDTARKITTVSVDELGLSGADLLSPTRVVAVTRHAPTRRTRVVHGTDPEHVAALMAAVGAAGEVPANPAPHSSAGAVPAGHLTWVVAEPDRPSLLAELIAAVRRTLPQTTIVVVAPALADPTTPMPMHGADEMLWIRAAASAGAVAATLADLAADHPPAVVLAPATTWGREVAARYGARTGCGVIADAIALEVNQGHLIGHKCSPDGAVAHVVSDSATQVVTMRPGVSPAFDAGADPSPPRFERTVEATAVDRVRQELGERDLDADALAAAQIVIGIGRGVDAADMHLVSDLARVLNAQVGASRAVTDAQLLPVSRQIGITGRSIAPAVYIALGIAGKATHMLGVRHAGTVIAINSDRQAPVFDTCDLGIVADWRDVAATMTRLGRQPESTSARS